MKQHNQLLLKAKVEQCFALYKYELLQYRPEEVFLHAPQIYLATQAVKVAVDFLDEDISRELMKFKNPLEILVDHLESCFAQDLEQSAIAITCNFWTNENLHWEYQYLEDDQDGSEVPVEQLEDVLEKMINDISGTAKNMDALLKLLRSDT